MSTSDPWNANPQQGQVPPAPARPPYGSQPPYGAPVQPPYGAPIQPPYGAPGPYPPVQQYPAGQPYPTGPSYPVAPQYGPPGAYGYPMPQAKPSTGTLSWALGFLIFIGIPFLSGIVSGVVMASVYRSVARKGEIARQNARAAANWALTYLTVSTALIIVHIIVLVAFAGNEGMSGFFPLGIPITLYFAVSILHVVLVIVGTVKASGGKVLQVPFAIPYIRS